MGDLLGSVGAIVAALVILYTGWTPVDPILSILVSCLVLRSAWRLLKESVNELLEGAPASMDIDELKRNLRRSVLEVRNVHHVHVWLVGEKPVMTLHVQVIPLTTTMRCSIASSTFWNITTTLAMPPFRWSISPVADRTATLTRRSPVIHIIMTTSRKARESLLARAVNPHPAAVQRDEGQQQIFQRHRIDALQGEDRHADHVDDDPQQPVLNVFTGHQNHRCNRQHHHAGIPERESIRLEFWHRYVHAEAGHDRNGNAGQEGKHRLM